MRRTRATWSRSRACPSRGTRRPTSAPAGSPARRFPQQRRPQHRRDGERQEPPRVHVDGDEARVGTDRDADSQRDPPVVAHDEVEPEARESLQVPHAYTGRRRRRSSETNASEASTTKTRRTGRAASSPGQWPPTPSCDQKIPNVVRSAPTENLSVFSGTRDSGARAAAPTAPTS